MLSTNLARATTIVHDRTHSRINEFTVIAQFLKIILPMIRSQNIHMEAQHAKDLVQELLFGVSAAEKLNNDEQLRFLQATKSFFAQGNR
mmetsp:Transcript_22332/g.34256  ORF Transcript_22332/g.34256 Transcript_22332/m.34256 type:complete len:89 (-) Transcript_22332:70-336(-)